MRRLLGTVVALLLVLASPAVQATHIPVVPDEDNPLEFESRVAALLSWGEFDPLVEIEARFEDEGGNVPRELERELRYKALTIGSYYRLHRNVKAGAFVRLQVGARHDDDWTEPLPAVWEWEDSTDRLEAVAILDVTPRFQLDFVPGENWVIALKTRYELNTFNLQQSIKVRPGLTYFWIVDRNPVLNVTASYEAYFPLNFGTTLIYEQWAYLNLLYHLTPTLKLEASVARRTVIWSDSEEFDEAHPTENYGGQDSFIKYRPWVLGFGILVMIPL